MANKTVPQPPYSPDLAPSDFWLFPKLRGCRYETIEEMKEAVMKVIGTLTQENFDGAFQRLLERHNKCIASGGDYFEGDLSFMCVLSIKVHTQKSLESYLMILVYIYICECVCVCVSQNLSPRVSCVHIFAVFWIQSLNFSCNTKIKEPNLP